jgi:hypothetical protein
VTVVGFAVALVVVFKAQTLRLRQAQGNGAFGSMRTASFFST